jgi:hypothetical protein
VIYCVEILRRARSFVLKFDGTIAALLVSIVGAALGFPITNRDDVVSN